MARHGNSLGTDYFETMFRETDDPWDLETSIYEKDKFEDSVRSLSQRRYNAGFEVGCAKGVLTLKLADRCAGLLSIDISQSAIDAARLRTASLDHVAFERMAFPSQAPVSMFDLVVLSEVAYYWADDDLKLAACWIDEHLAPGGDLLLVHYTGETDYPQSGDDAVAKLARNLNIPVDVVEAHRHPRYRLDLWRRRS